MTRKDHDLEMRWKLSAAQEQERTEQLAMAEAACRRDATALGVVRAELADLKAAYAWIVTSERMPEETCDVLGVVKGALMLLRYAPDEDSDFPWLDESIGCYPTSHVSHWMPLPKAQK